MSENDDDLSFWSNIMDKLGPEGIKKLTIQSMDLLVANMRLTNLLGNKIGQTVNNVEYCCCENKKEKRINMEELKNCPFCGGKAILRKRRPDHIMNGKSFVCCTECKNKTGYYEKEQDAINAWNIRVESSLNDINYCPHCGKKL